MSFIYPFHFYYLFIHFTEKHPEVQRAKVGCLSLSFFMRVLRPPREGDCED